MQIARSASRWASSLILVILTGLSGLDRVLKNPDSRPVKRIARTLASRAQSNGFVRGLTSLAESNSDVGSLNLHDWCFRLARQAPSLYGATEGSASEAADVRLESFGLSRGLSAAAESAFPEGAIASILRDASGGKRASGPMLA